MSSEELRIRGELEKDIERALEEEIKDEICRLALRLHRLYQQPKKKKMEKKNTFSHEVSINIRTEGATRIEIKEIKKNIQEKTEGRRLVHHQKKGTGIIAPKSKKFDWANSLRSAGPNINSLHADNIIHDSCGCNTQGETRKNASMKKQKQHMGNKADKNMQLELGWKD